MSIAVIEKIVSQIPSAEQVRESIQKLESEADAEREIAAAKDQLEKLRENAITQREFDLKNQAYRDSERRFEQSGEIDPRATEMAEFRNRFSDEQRAIAKAVAALESHGHRSDEVRHAGPTGSTHAERLQASLARSKRLNRRYDDN